MWRRNAVRLEVPEEFAEVLRKIEREVAPENVVNWLEWASRNPEGAKRIAKAYKKLGRCGRHEFEVCLLLNYSPEEAVRSAERRDRESREKRSLLSKVVANSRKGGYRFKLWNGVECVILFDEEAEAYWFHFNVAGEEISILYKRKFLWMALDTLKYRGVNRVGIKTIAYQGKFYSYSFPSVAETLVKAIEENVNPKVLAAVNL